MKGNLFSLIIMMIIMIFIMIVIIIVFPVVNSYKMIVFFFNNRLH